MPTKMTINFYFILKKESGEKGMSKEMEYIKGIMNEIAERYSLFESGFYRYDDFVSDVKFTMMYAALRGISDSKYYAILRYWGI